MSNVREKMALTLWRMKSLRYKDTPFSLPETLQDPRSMLVTMPFDSREFEMANEALDRIAREEHRFMKRTGIAPVTARECHASDDWVDRVLDALSDHVYVTVDIDAFDPAFAPGTGTPEPGGLDWYQVITLLRLVAAEKRIVGADIVEVIPLPGQVVTESLAARLLYKLICYIESKE